MMSRLWFPHLFEATRYTILVILKANVTDDPEAETVAKTVPCWLDPLSIIIS